MKKSHNDRQLEVAHPHITPDDIAKLSQWARLDPRLAEILTGYLSKKWDQIPTLSLLTALSKLPWPRAILVPLRFVTLSQQNNSTDHNLLKSQTTALKALIHAIEQRFPQKSDDLFFIPLQRPNRVVIENEIARKSKPYTQSGFIGSASLLAKGRVPEKRTLLSQKTRQLLLDQITETLLENTSISVSDYINSCGGAISRRQAQRDLESNPNLKAIGHTRNRRYLPKKTR